jgi:hypothetical protein
MYCYENWHVERDIQSLSIQRFLIPWKQQEQEQEQEQEREQEQEQEQGDRENNWGRGGISFMKFRNLVIVKIYQSRFETSLFTGSFFIKKLILITCERHVLFWKIIITVKL